MTAGVADLRASDAGLNEDEVDENFSAALTRHFLRNMVRPDIEKLGNGAVLTDEMIEQLVPIGVSFGVTTGDDLINPEFMAAIIARYHEFFRSAPGKH